MDNSQLSAAKKAKNDEFYTRMTDIEHELVHYRDHFKGKVVLCNCDDPFESNFFKYFALNFNHLGLGCARSLALARCRVGFSRLSAWCHRVGTCPGSGGSTNRWR